MRVENAFSVWKKLKHLFSEQYAFTQSIMAVKTGSLAWPARLFAFRSNTILSELL